MASDYVAASVAAGNTNGRIVMGTTGNAFKNASAHPTKGTPVSNAGNSKPGVSASSGNPQPKNVVGGAGASYRITARMSAITEPEATHTQANGRIMPATRGQSGNFWAEAL